MVCRNHLVSLKLWIEFYMEFLFFYFYLENFFPLLWGYSLILILQVNFIYYLSWFGCSKLAIVANRNNTDQHIVLLGWLQEVENEVAVIDIERDKSLPRIELQG